MARKPRIPGELTNVKFFMLLTPSEYLELRDAASEEGESMAEYVRRSVCVRFRLKNPSAMPFGERFR